MPKNAVDDRKPANLRSGGSDLWDSIAGAYELRPDELRTLADACREADLIDRLEAEMVDAPTMVKGSMGQLVASPLISEVRQHRSTLNTLLKALRLPEDQATPAERSQSARKAANARWSTRGA